MLILEWSFIASLPTLAACERPTPDGKFSIVIILSMTINLFPNRMYHASSFLHWCLHFRQSKRLGRVFFVTVFTAALTAPILLRGALTVHIRPVF